MATAKELPSQEWLLERLTYNPDTGELRWKTRPREDFKSLAAWSIWRASCEGKKAGSITGTGYLTLMINGSHFNIHRLIWKMVTGRDPEGFLDHMNRDRTDNRISNLREVDPIGSAQNRGTQSNNKSGIPGVWFDKKRRKFEAFIHIEKTRKHLGRFDTLEEAVEAREKAKEKHGFLSPSDPQTQLHEIASEPAIQIDNSDFDRWESRLKNLKGPPSGVSLKNRKTRTDNTSGHRGVTWHEGGGKWMAYLNLHGKHHHLGLFVSLDEAIKARQEAERRLGFRGA